MELSQTTSNSLAYLTHFLANHEDVQQKLLDEVDAFLAENEVAMQSTLCFLSLFFVFFVYFLHNVFRQSKWSDSPT